MSACQTFEDYLRGQVEKGQYGVAIIQARIALDIADYIEKHRRFTIEPKKGKWIHGRELSREMIGDVVTAIFYEGWECSECHCLVSEEREPLWNYCPNCGADMREGEADEAD